MVGNTGTDNATAYNCNICRAVQDFFVAEINKKQFVKFRQIKDTAKMHL